MRRHMRHLRSVDHLPAYPHHCEHLQQALREGQDQGSDHQKEEDGGLELGQTAWEFVQGQEPLADLAAAGFT